MAMVARKNLILQTLVAVGRGIDIARRIVVNVLFLVVLGVLLALASAEPAPKVPDRAALVVAPQGRIVEQLTGDPTARAIQRLMGNEVAETLSRDLIDALRSAAGDERIAAVVLDLDQMSGVGWGLSKLQDVRAAIDEVKQTGKPVIATADFYGTSRYYLASVADEIFLHHQGLVVLDGYGRFRTYYKDGLDRLQVDWHVFKAGNYKSAVEPYERNGMSPEAQEANLGFLNDLWDAYLAEVAAARGTTAAALKDGIARLGDHLTEAGGKGSEMALRLGLVDRVGDRDAVRDRLVELVGEDPKSRSFYRVNHQDYLEALGSDRFPRPTRAPAVGILVARGQMLDGSHPPGTIGGDSTAALIRRARYDDDLKALVVRIDSGGGSAFAAEVIRRELDLLREAGKPVVVSMGSVAASGGYWITTPADEIWASPTTITGSIGVYGMFPTFQKPIAEYLGMRVDGVGTTWLSGVRPDRELPEGLATILQQLTDRTYLDFRTLVAEARGMSLTEVDAIAEGRVWSGIDAHELGLVDHLGGLSEAIASAARRADLGDEYGVRYLEEGIGVEDRILLELLSRVAAWYPARSAQPRSPLVGESVMALLSRQVEMLARLNDPHGIYADCLCEL